MVPFPFVIACTVSASTWLDHAVPRAQIKATGLWDTRMPVETISTTSQSDWCTPPAPPGVLHGVGHSLASTRTDTPAACSCFCEQNISMCLAWDWDTKSHRCSARGTLLPVGSRSTIIGGVVTRPEAPGASFSAGFSDNAVLQRTEPGGSGRQARAAVYGTPGHGFRLPCRVSVTVVEHFEGGGRPDKVLLETQVGVTNETGYGEWKVLLPPHKAGGNLTITAQCVVSADSGQGSCGGNLSVAKIVNVTYGDVFWCAGQVFAAMNASVLNAVPVYIRTH